MKRFLANGSEVDLDFSFFDIRGERMRDWQACCRAANRITDLFYAVHLPGNTAARAVAPVATVAEIIAGELGIEVPEMPNEAEQLDIDHMKTRCTVCGECTVCNLRPCRDGGPHKPNQEGVN